MTRLNDIASDPALLYYYGQKAVRKNALRDLGARCVVALRRRAPIHGDPHAEPRVARELARDGISFLPALTLEQDDLRDIFSVLESRPLTDQYTSKQVGTILEELPASCVRLEYQARDVVSCAPLVRLANHPTVLAAVTEALGAKPCIAKYQAWWTLGEHQAQGPTHYDDIFHRDVDDFRFIKLFAYLTDTTADSGAHCYVKGSHRSDLFTRRGAITDQEVAASFPAESIVTIAGKAGTAFLENTWGIHRPLLATHGRRLIFSVIYCLTPWLPGRPPKPFLPLPEGLDLEINRSFFYQA